MGGGSRDNLSVYLPPSIFLSLSFSVCVCVFQMWEFEESAPVVRGAILRLHFVRRGGWAEKRGKKVCGDGGGGDLIVVAV
jgi:hypothetical protein